IGKRRLQQWIAADGAVGVDEAKVRIQLLETWALNAAGVAQIDVDVVSESAADMDAREVASVDVIRFQPAGDHFAPIVLRAQAWLPGPIAGLELERAVRRERLMSAFQQRDEIRRDCWAKQRFAPVFDLLIGGVERQTHAEESILADRAIVFETGVGVDLVGGVARQDLAVDTNDGRERERLIEIDAVLLNHDVEAQLFARACPVLLEIEGQLIVAELNFVQD